MGFLTAIRSQTLIYDGSKGTVLQSMGLPPGHPPEEWNLSCPHKIREIHRNYLASGCHVIQTNTFTGNRMQLKKYGLENSAQEINSIAARLAREEAADKAWVAGSIGPTGLLSRPYGELSFEEAFQVYLEQATALAAGGAQLLHFETFSDIGEMKAAILAGSVTELPLVATMAFGTNGRTLMGIAPYGAAVAMHRFGARVVGANCSFGPANMFKVAEEMDSTGLPLVFKPNAGLPRLVQGAAVYDQTPEDFAREFAPLFRLNTVLAGGCCGTTPDHMAILSRTNPIRQRISGSLRPCLVSPMKTVFLDCPISVGRVVLSEQDDPTSCQEAENQDVLEVTLEGADGNLLAEKVRDLAAYCKQPLILTARNREILPQVIRSYPGVPGIRESVGENYGAVVLGEDFPS